ncbi:hypothetical protein ABIC83_002920 [Roseateles asaccharophilus]|uniref:hypothetical protein n=1 Tax=Roseateles asaccharophilus TaxID=582607 RepID=UPI003837EB68
MIARLAQPDLSDTDGTPLLRVVGTRPHPGPVLRKEHFQEVLDWTCQQPPATLHLHFANLIAQLIHSKGLWGVEKLRRLVHGEFGGDVAQAALASLQHGVAPAVSFYDGEERSYTMAPAARLCLRDSGAMLRLVVLMEAGVPKGASMQERSDWLDVLSGSKMKGSKWEDGLRDLLTHVYDLTNCGRSFQTSDPGTRFFISESVALQAVHLAISTNSKHESIERIMAHGGPLGAMISAEVMRVCIEARIGGLPPTDDKSRRPHRAL